MSIPQRTTGGNSPDILSCSRCNAQLPPRAVFCGSCGGRVKQGNDRKRETSTENDDNDARSQEVDTIRIRPLSQIHVKRRQLSQLLENDIIAEQPHINSSLPQKVEVSEQLMSSSSETESKPELVDLQTQDEASISTELSEFLSSATDPSKPVSATWPHVPKTEVPAVLGEIVEQSLGDSLRGDREHVSVKLTSPSISLLGNHIKKYGTVPFAQQLKQRITGPLPTVSRMPQRNIVSHHPESNWLWPTIIILSAFAAGLVNFVFTDIAIRPVIVFWFLIVCPGMLLVRFLRLKEPIVEWTLALALSFAIDALVAGIQMYTGKWSPAVTLSILIGFCFIVATVQLAKQASATGIKVYPIIKAIKGLITVRRNPVSTSRGFKRPSVMDIILLLLPLLALFLWSISLQTITLNDMNDLGLISALSPRIIIALCILVVSFALSLQRHKVRVSLLAFQLICIILILYTTPNLIEETLRFAPVYRSAGYTDYIMQTGTVNTGLDFYFNVPGFYVLSAFFTKVFRYSSILSYAGWAPLFYNLIYAGPIYAIFTSITANKRLVWLTLLFFYLTNWVGQDCFSPQGLNFFLFLVIIMILLKWFRMPPKQQMQLSKDVSLVQKFFAWLKAPDPQSPSIEPWQRRGLLCSLILIFGLVVFSHPLTPFFTLLSVFLLVVFRRCYPFWLPILMLAMTAFWDFVIAGPYLSQHYNLIVSLGDLMDNVPKTITSGKLSGDALYHIIAMMRLYMTVLLWFLAFLGGIKRLRQRNRDITFILLAIAGFPLIAAQGYGGEMLSRIYFITEPFMCFFAASLFCDNPTVIARKPTCTRVTFPWRTAVILAANLFLLGSFFFTRYGDERVDYISYGEWNAVQYLYQIAPANALILSGWDYTPLYFKDYAKYDIKSLISAYPETVIHTNTSGILDLIQNEGRHNSYMIFSQEEQVVATSINGLPGDALQRLETALLQTRKFTLVYRNSDAEILQFVGDSETYYGTIYNISANVTTKMTLTELQLQQGKISGYFTGLHLNAPFKGLIDPSKHIQFDVTDSPGNAMLSFDGSVQSNGNLVGNYCSLDQEGQCDGPYGYGLWSVAPTSPGGYYR